MKKAILSSLTALAVAAFVFLAPIPGSSYQGKGKGLPTSSPFGDPYGPYYAAPQEDGGPFERDSAGHPNMQGYWTPRLNRSIFSVQGKQGAIVDPTDGMLPYRPQAAAKAKDLQENYMYLETEAHCYQSGVPKVAYQQFGYQIVQTPDYVIQMPEYAHSYRIIPTDGREHIPGDVKLFMGDGVGRWEGDTLIVETTNLNGVPWLDMEGNFTTENMHVVERFTMVNANQIDYEATVTDDTIYTQPWTIRGNLGRHDDPNYELMEFACHEGNRDLQHYPESEGGSAKEVGARTQ